ncbi:hypothetical protein YC2023_084045 [Brassica napus]
MAHRRLSSAEKGKGLDWEHQEPARATPEVKAKKAAQEKADEIAGSAVYKEKESNRDAQNHPASGQRKGEFCFSATNCEASQSRGIQKKEGTTPITESQNTKQKSGKKEAPSANHHKQEKDQRLSTKEPLDPLENTPTSDSYLNLRQEAITGKCQGEPRRTERRVQVFQRYTKKLQSGGLPCKSHQYTYLMKCLRSSSGTARLYDTIHKKRRPD